MGGCIPLWTFLEQTPPLPRILRHERILVRLTATTRPALAHLETLLGCYTPTVRKALLANLEMAWPAFAWGNGTAYHHVLLEMAELTNKRVPSAMAAILKVEISSFSPLSPRLSSVSLSVYQSPDLASPGPSAMQAHGPKYVAEMLTVNLQQYASLAGMREAIELRKAMQLDDPLAAQLRSVEQCIARIPGVGSPAALAAATSFVAREHWGYWLNQSEAVKHRTSFVRAPFPRSIKRGHGRARYHN